MDMHTLCLQACVRKQTRRLSETPAAPTQALQRPQLLSCGHPLPHLQRHAARATLCQQLLRDDLDRGDILLYPTGWVRACARVPVARDGEDRIKERRHSGSAHTHHGLLVPRDAAGVAEEGSVPVELLLACEFSPAQIGQAATGTHTQRPTSPNQVHKQHTQQRAPILRTTPFRSISC